MSKLAIFVSALMVLSQCQSGILNTETVKVICDEWESSLFLPSVNDTLETAQGLNDQFPVQEAACFGVG